MAMNVKLRQLAYFKAVVDHGTIAAAAQALHVAQPPLSKQIRQLEAEWGVALFERINHRLHLREEGRYLYSRACDLLQMADDVDERMRALAQGRAGEVRVGTTAAGIEPVARAIGRINAESDPPRYVCWEGEPHALQVMVEQRRLDLAVVPRPVEIEGLSARTLAPLTYVALAAPERALAPSCELDEIARHPLLLLHRRSRSGSYERILDAFYARALTPKVVAECSDVSILHALVRRDIGIALVAVNANEPREFDNTSIRAHAVRDMPDSAAELVLIHKSQIPPSAVMERFITALQSPV